MSLARIELMTSRKLRKASGVQNNHSTIVTMYDYGKLLLFAEHKARIKISSKTMILTVFPISLSFLYQMPWNILQSISTPTLQCIGWPEYLFSLLIAW